MALRKVTYESEKTVISAENLNDIQDAVIMLEDGLFAIDNDKSGTAITITDASKRGFRSLNIYGKTTQNGTPTPENPVDLVSVGNGGSITVNVSGEDKAQSMTIATPNGLPGIQVTSGGNYTDANGQQWICDEIDFFRGVYIKRVCAKPFDGTESWAYENTREYFMLSHSVLGSAVMGLPLSSHFVRGTASTSGNFFVGSSGIAFYHTAVSVNEWKTFLSEQLANKKPVTLLYGLATPIETPLSPEELAAYASLHTYKEHTTVSNDSGAWMDLEYVMDAKKYFEGKIAGGTSPYTVNKISVTESADGTVTMVNTLSTGGTETIVISPDGNGNPNSITYNGVAIPIEWVVSE